MVRVEQDLQQIGVAARAATILRRTTPRTLDDARIPNGLVSREDSLKADIVLQITQDEVLVTREKRKSISIRKQLAGVRIFSLT